MITRYKYDNTTGELVPMLPKTQPTDALLLPPAKKVARVTWSKGKKITDYSDGSSTVEDDGAYRASSPDDQLLPLSNPDHPVKVYGSATGWLSFKNDEDKEFFMVPCSWMEKNKKLRVRDTKQIWTHLGDFFMVEA